jgi:tyrosinase
MSSFNITGVQSGRGQDGSVPLRLEIRELQKNADLWNLYMLGLDRLQRVNQSNLLSYYQLAGMRISLASYCSLQVDSPHKRNKGN